MVELLNDEELMVRLEAIEALVEIMPGYLQPEQIDQDIMPVVANQLRSTEDEENLARMSALIGKLMFNLPLEKTRKTYAKEFIEFFQRCGRAKELGVRTNAAINLPCFFYYFGNYDVEEIDFVELYCEFADDEDKEVRVIVAKGMHEVLTLTEKSGRAPYLFNESF